MGKIKNRSTIPQGMLAPSGYSEPFVNPNVQATVRPSGTLLTPSPGYDSIRRGKNIFQGRGPTGGFREMEFAEDVGGTGAALAIVPGSTTELEASEWLPESEDSVPEGSMIISDRGQSQEPGFASFLHEAYDKIPDMGDRHPSRPLSRRNWFANPVAMIRADYQKDPAFTVGAMAALILVFNVVVRDLERSYSGYRGSGPGTAVTAAPAAVADESGTAVASATNDIGKAADSAVDKIEKAGDKVIRAIESAAPKGT